MKSNCCLRAGIAACFLLPVTPAAFAQGFAASISPSRFELQADAGDVIRETVAITNPAERAADYVLKTADWYLDDASNLHYSENSLTEGSCRPWVRLERRTISVRAGGRKNYRFEIHVPEGTPPGLCRFAILIEPAEAYTARINDGTVSLPVVGRYAVITYVTIGDAEPAIENVGISKVDSNGLWLPAITLRNTGVVHDRAFGQITATDANGRRVSMIPSTFPILPGRTETLAFAPEQDVSGASPLSLDNQLEYPLEIRGRLEIGGETIQIDARID